MRYTKSEAFYKCIKEVRKTELVTRRWGHIVPPPTFEALERWRPKDSKIQNRQVAELDMGFAFLKPYREGHCTAAAGFIICR